MSEEHACLVRARSDSENSANLASFGSMRAMTYTEDKLNTTEASGEPAATNPINLVIPPNNTGENESGELLDYNDSSVLDQFHEDAIRQAGCGISQIRVIFACSLAIVGASLELSAIPFVLPSAEIELCVLHHERNWLVLISLMGCAFGSVGWGSLSARLGRRRTLLSCLAVNAVFATIAAFMPTYGTFMMASDTDADPHNSKRGFFYSHIGWTFLSTSDLVRQKGLEVDMKDITNNPVLRFQKKYAGPFYLFFMLLNIEIPALFWGESLSVAWHVFMLRLALNLNAISLINSAAHLFGNRPYDKNIQPVQNLSVSLFTLGEGFHNYHHTFPWDYKAGEFGNNILNISTLFIDFFAWIGWAYDLKSVPDEMIRSRAIRTGDNTNLWGWEDEEMNKMMNKASLANKT